MAFDGTRALIVGDYVTVDGELGPWTALVEAVRIEPRSTFMKSVFAVYGVAWLVVAAFFARGARWARRGMLLAAAGSLWYLVVGTASSALQIALLLVLDWSERRGKPNPG